MSVSAETRAKQRAAKLGRKLSPEHKANISAAAWRYWQNPETMVARLGLTDELEAADYRNLRRHGYSRAEALAAIGRSDLIGGAE